MRDATWAEVLAMFPEDAYARHSVDPESLASVWVDGSSQAVVWINTHHFAGRPWALMLGEPTAATSLVAEVRAAHSDAFGGITHEIGTWLPEDFLFDQSWNWDWFWTGLHAPERDQPEVTIDWVDESVYDDLRAVLHAASDWRSVEPGEERAERWAALRHDDEIVSCLAVTRSGRGTPNLASVATHPDQRGRGFARDVTAWTTNRLLDEGSPVVTLGMYSDNDAARKVYDALGYTVGHEFRSGHLRSSQDLSPA
jgi:GNAT superfamily N-acetyltransferase